MFRTSRENWKHPPPFLEKKTLSDRSVALFLPRVNEADTESTAKNHPMKIEVVTQKEIVYS